MKKPERKPQGTDAESSSTHKCRFVRWIYTPREAANRYIATCIECGAECRKQPWARTDGSIEDLQESDVKHTLAIQEREAQLARLKWRRA